MQNTTIEKLIIIAIIGILGAVAWGAFGARNASAHDPMPVAIQTVLHDMDASYQWSNHSLNILNKGTAPWTNAAFACAALKSLDPTLSTLTVTMPSDDGRADLRWSKSDRGNVYSNQPTIRTANC
jgi:hypothetical protein